MAYEAEVKKITDAATALQQFNAEWDAQMSRLINAEANAAVSMRQAAASSAEAAVKAAQGGTSATAPPTTGADDGTGLVVAGVATRVENAVYVNDTFNLQRYKDLAAQMGTEVAHAYRYGPSPAQYGTAGNTDRPTLYKNVDHSGDEMSQARNPGMKFARGCNLGSCGSWQLGGPLHANEAGMYSSNMGQGIWIPDNRQASVGGMGITDLIPFDCGANVAQIKPELPWHYGGAGLDATQAKLYKNEGKNIAYITAIGRGEGRPGWNICNLAVTRDGLIFITGQNTGYNRATAQLAAGMVPTGAAVLNSNEFAFIPVWDTNTGRGKVAVVAMAGTPQNCYLGSDTSKWENYRGEWRDVFPGMPSYGNISFLKVVDYIELPADMRCPTELSASTYHYWGNYTGLQDNTGGTGYNLRLEAHRAVFRSTGQKWMCMPESALLVVISKEEKKACFIDLSPLIKYYKDTYLSTNGVGTVGLNPGQFPLTSTEYPAQKPTIIKTVTLDDFPTAVRCTRYDLKRRVYIATQKGKLQLWDVGNYPAKVGSNPDPASIKLVGTVDVARNPTHIATIVRHSGAGGAEGGSGEASYFGKRVYPNADFEREVIVTCRGDRTVQWVRFDANYVSGSVIREIRDTRLVDPIMTQDGENHTTEHYEVTVSDYAGRQLINYRYGPLIFWNYQGYMNDGGDNIYYNWDAGLPPDGIKVTPTTFNGTTFNIECGGAFAVPGKPFAHGFANVY